MLLKKIKCNPRFRRSSLVISSGFAGVNKYDDQEKNLMFMSFCRNDSSANHSQCCVFTHVASIYANLLEQKKAFT